MALSLDVRVLGPLAVLRSGEPVRLGAAKQRALLGLLLIRRSGVDRDLAVDGLWGERPPSGARNTLQAYVSRLRNALGREAIETTPTGYRLDLDPESVDADRFEGLYHSGREALGAGDAVRAQHLLAEALALWRGPAFADLRFEAFAQVEAGRLDESRLACLEERIDADLQLGRHAALVGELEALVVEQPLRERLRSQLILALYRSGRQSEALAQYQATRRMLVDELGLEPSPQLRDLERMILAHDPSLAAPMQAVSSRLNLPLQVTPFIGRGPEIGALVTALEAAHAGQGRLITVSGEPGIGKTRLLLELAALAEASGADVVLGRCYEREGAPPYWPWVQVIRAYAERAQRDELRFALGAGAAVIAEIVPELRELLPELGQLPASDDPKQRRFRLFDSIATFLRNAAAKRVLVAMLDNFHAADADSLLLLEFVANELVTRRLLVVCTYRETEVLRHHPLARTLLELGRSHPLERLRLSGLSEDESVRLIETRAGRDVSAAVASTLYERTDGNPLFLSELLRLLVEEGELDRGSLTNGHSRSLRIPEGVREVIGQRLERLSEPCNSVLRTASAIGRSFHIDQLEHVIDDDLSKDLLLDALEEALAGMLIEELPNPVGRYQFSHALIRETLSAELSTAQRLRLHARIAETFERLYAGKIEDHSAELAYQFAEAEGLLGPEKALHYLQLAGEQAVDAHAYEEAIDHFKQALGVTDDRGPGGQTAGLLVGLARAELGALELYEVGPALSRLVEAFEYYVEAGETTAALAVATQPIPPVWEPTAFPEVVEQALEMVDDDSIDAGRLLSTLGWFRSVHQRDYLAGETAFAHALAIAQAHADLALERRTLVNAAHADYWQLAWPRCRERGLRAVELASAATDQRTEMAAREWPARVDAILGELASARTHAAVAVELAEKLRERHELANACMYSSWLYSLGGDWARARELSDRALALEPREPRNLSTRALLELQTGHTDEGERYLTQLLDPLRMTNWSLLEKFAMAAFLPLAARILGTTDRLDLAQTTAESALLATRMPPFMHLYGRIGLAFIAVERADPDLAVAQYEAFETQRNTAIMMAGIAVDRLLGLLAAVLGRAEQARDHFEQALAFTSQAGYLPELAWSASDYAAAIRDGAVPGDDATAQELRQQALDIARGIAMVPLTARIQASS